MDRPAFFTVEEFAAELRVSDDLLRKLIADDVIHVVRLGPRTQRIPATELERLTSLIPSPALDAASSEVSEGAA